jgi:hypothetical protein
MDNPHNEEELKSRNRNLQRVRLARSKLIYYFPLHFDRKEM